MTKFLYFFLIILFSCSEQVVLPFRNPSSDEPCEVIFDKFVKVSPINENTQLIELPVLKVKDQCQWGSCWVHSPIEKLELNFHRKYKQGIELSTDYFYANYLLSQFASEAFGLSKFEEGNYTNFFRVYANQFGLIPKNAFKSNIKIHSESSKTINFYKYLQAKLTELRELKKSNEKEHLLNEVKNKFEELYTLSKTQFEFKGETFNPQSFSKKYFSELNENIRVYSFQEYKNNYLKLGHQEKDILAYQNGEFKKIKFTFESESISKEDMIDLITRNIEAGNPVPVEVQWPYDKKFILNGKSIPYIDNQTGVMTASARPINFESEMSHAVLIVGLKKINDKVLSFKILNSYGEKSGNRGFYEMDINYFEKFMIHMYL